MNIDKNSMRWNNDNIQLISEELKNNKSFALDVINHYGVSLQFFSEQLKNDYDVVMLAVLKNGKNFNFINEQYQYDRNMVVLASQTVSTLGYLKIPAKLKQDRDLMNIFLEKSAINYIYLPSKLKNDFDITLACVKQYSLYKHVPKSLKTHWEIMNAAFRQNKNEFMHIPPQFDKDNLSHLKYVEDKIKFIRIKSLECELERKNNNNVNYVEQKTKKIKL